MTRIVRLPLVDGHEVFALTDWERRCPTCGRAPCGVLSVSVLEHVASTQLYNLLRERFLAARQAMRNPPPCDHGLVARCRARHERRHSGGR